MRGVSAKNYERGGTLKIRSDGWVPFGRGGDATSDAPLLPLRAFSHLSLIFWVHQLLKHSGLPLALASLDPHAPTQIASHVATALVPHHILPALQRGRPRSALGATLMKHVFYDVTQVPPPPEHRIASFASSSFGTPLARIFPQYSS